MILETLLKPCEASWFRKKLKEVLDLNELYTSMLHLFVLMFPLEGIMRLVVLRWRMNGLGKEVDTKLDL